MREPKEKKGNRVLLVNRIVFAPSEAAAQGSGHDLCWRRQKTGGLGSGAGFRVRLWGFAVSVLGARYVGLRVRRIASGFGVEKGPLSGSLFEAS